MRNWGMHLLGVAFATGALSSCGNENAGRMLQLSGSTMGTFYNIKIVDFPAAMTRDSVEASVAAILEQVNSRMSTYRSDSELSRLNQNGSGGWIDVSTELLDVIEAARQVSVMSGGAFDVTVGPLVNLWGFGAEGERRVAPSPTAIVETLSRVGYEKMSIRRSPPGIRKANRDIYIDLSAIAKGYAVDRIADHLESRGARNYLVEIGGDLKVKGRNPKGGPWIVAIEKPAASGRSIQRLIQVTDQAIATSGDYRNFFENNGQRFSHTIDPTSGMPVSHRLASVTVLNQAAMRADALATALMVLGPKHGYELAHRLEMKAYFIAETEQGITENSTPGFKRYLAANAKKRNGDIPD